MKQRYRTIGHWRSIGVLGAIALAGCGFVFAHVQPGWRNHRSRDLITELYAFPDPSSSSGFGLDPGSNSGSNLGSHLGSNLHSNRTPVTGNPPGFRSSIAPTDPPKSHTPVYEPISGFGRWPDRVIETPVSSPSPTATTTPEATELTPTSVDRLTLLGDTDRDGVIGSADRAGRDQWSWSRGGIVPVNLDDDDRDGQPDAIDRTLRDQTADDRDLATLRLLLPETPEIPETINSRTRIYLRLNPTARPYVNVFQRTARGWKPIDTEGKTPIVFSRDVVFGIEGRSFATGTLDHGGRGRWNGHITIEAIVRVPGRREPITTDRLQLRVTPWLMSPGVAAVETVYVTDIPETNAFAKQLAAIVEPRGVEVVRETIGTLWMQDTMELGYTQIPGGAGFATWQTTPVVLDGVRKNSPGIYAQDRFAKTLLAPNFSLLRVTTPRSLPEADRWLDWYGNLEVSPPVPGFPLGRIYYGRSSSSFHPDLVEFLAAQELQAPAVEIDTHWLHIRHVDEIIGFLPHPRGGSVATIVSPQAGLDLLTAWRDRGGGGESLTLPDGTVATVAELLADQDWVAHNQAIEREHLSVVRGQLRSEFGLSADRIMALPVVFMSDGRAVWSNPVNSLVVNGVVVVGEPWVGKGNETPVRSAVAKAIAPLGLTVRFIDDGYYHWLGGNVHCATNTRRSAPAVPFWRLDGLPGDQPSASE